MDDEIVQLLESNKLRQEVITNIQSVWSYAGTLYDNPHEDMEEYVEQHQGASLWEEAWWRAETCGEVGKIEQAFYKYVIQKMSKPYRLTLKELFEAFLDLAKPDERHYGDFEQFSSDDCNNLYAIFVNYVKNHILSHRHSDAFPICAVTYDQFEEGKPLWHKNSVSVRLLRGADVLEHSPIGKKLHDLVAVIEGEISTLACSRLKAEMIRILPSAIRSADLLQTTAFGEYKVVEPTIPVIYEREIKGLPWIEGKLIENGKILITQYLDAYYIEPTKKDSIERRIRNAVDLLVESDNQPNDAIAIALSMTAIEALLGEKGEGIATKLADNVAVLLEPDTSQRNNATEFVKDLYNNIRSKALHGELVETENKTRFDARHLAAAVLSGVLSRRDFLRRLDYEPETPQDLLKELRDTRFDSGQPVGVEEYNVRQLWRKQKKSIV